METSSKIKFTFVALIFLAFIVGGYILMQKSYSFSFDLNENKKEDNVKKENIDIRLDKSKDYIYFGEVEKSVEELDIGYKHIYFNFEENTGLADILNGETDKEKETLVFDEALEDDEYSKLVSASYKSYLTYEYENYYSLIVNYYEFQKETLVSYKNSKTYVFDKNTGNILSNDELLNMYSLNISEVKNKVKTYIEDINLLDKNENLDADATVLGMENINLYINKLGKLTVTVLVKSDQKDYNEDIVLS